jgi:hypothetical protein
MGVTVRFVETPARVGNLAGVPKNARWLFEMSVERRWLGPCSFPV